MNTNGTTDAETLWKDNDLAFLEEMLHKYGNDDSILDVSELDGFLTAIISSPDITPSSRWFSALWGGAGNEPDWQSEEELQRFMTLLIQLMNSNASTLMEAPEQFRALFRTFEEDNQTPFLIAEEWCFGYMRGVDLNPWPTLPAELDTQLQAIALHGREEYLDHLETLSESEHQHTVAQIEPATRALHHHWLQQRAPEPTTNNSPQRTESKTGRNDPCPCGSDKKFKHCCLH